MDSEGKEAVAVEVGRGMGGRVVCPYVEVYFW